MDLIMIRTGAGRSNHRNSSASPRSSNRVGRNSRQHHHHHHYLLSPSEQQRQRSMVKNLLLTSRIHSVINNELQQHSRRSYSYYTSDHCSFEVKYVGDNNNEHPASHLCYEQDDSVIRRGWIRLAGRKNKNVDMTSGCLLLGGSPEFDDTDGRDEVPVVQTTVANNTVFRLTNWLTDWILTSLTTMDDENDCNDDRHNATTATSDRYSALEDACSTMDTLAGLFLADSHHHHNLSFHLAKSVAMTRAALNANANDEDEDEDAASTDTEVSDEDRYRLHLNMDVFLFDDVFTQSRIDWAINQMDISQMARNAARHLNVKSIHELPTKVYRSNDCDMMSSSIGESWHVVSAQPRKVDRQDNDEDEKCVICLANFQDGDQLRVLPCGHNFHVGCIDHWLLGTYSDDECITTGCPTCKKTVECDSAADDDTCLHDEEEITSVDGGSEAASNGHHTDSSFPSWAFLRLGSMLSKDSDSNGGGY
mmetsp:Transcript_9185/g.13593  ORF Transcript_9185/g.13593 Transcript_9185/m.13593 type:complete len:478 (-) Transcript_9185:59-1492(-)